MSSNNNDPKNPNPNGPNRAYSKEEQAQYDATFALLTNPFTKFMQPSAEGAVNKYEAASAQEEKEIRTAVSRGYVDPGMDHDFADRSRKHPITGKMEALADATRDAGVYNADHNGIEVPAVKNTTSKPRAK